VSDPRDMPPNSHVTPDAGDRGCDAILPDATDNGEPSHDGAGAEYNIPPSAATRMAPSLPAGADPDAVRDWFECETIVSPNFARF
jgi:hypothetical protein